MDGLKINLAKSVALVGQRMKFYLAQFANNLNKINADHGFARKEKI